MDLSPGITPATAVPPVGSISVPGEGGSDGSALSGGSSAGPWTGQLLGGRYQIAELIGCGGSAGVYRGFDTRVQRQVAVKIFHRPAADSGVISRRRAEVDFLVRLDHPGLVALLDADIAADRGASQEPAYLVMEFLEGTSLEHRLRTGVLTPQTAGDIGRQVAAALAAVHRRGVIHRDVKPGNILLGATGTAKLADFGIARLMNSAHLTGTAEVLGTPLYLSPEQARGTEVGPATDIYSLGLVLLECLTGSPAFPGHAAESAMARLARDPAVPERLPQAWVNLLTHMTHTDPGLRPAAAAVSATLTRLLPADHTARTATTVISATLCPALREPPDAAAAPRPHRPTATRSRRIRVRALSFVAGGLTVALAAAVIQMTDPTPGGAGHHNQESSAPANSLDRPASPNTDPTASTDAAPGSNSQRRGGPDAVTPMRSTSAARIQHFIPANAPRPMPTTTVTVTATAPPSTDPAPVDATPTGDPATADGPTRTSGAYDVTTTAATGDTSGATRTTIGDTSVPTSAPTTAPSAQTDPSTSTPSTIAGS